MKLFPAILLSLFLGTASAQESYLKAGANLTLSFLTGQGSAYQAKNIFHPVFPGLNFSYEKPFGKRFSWLINIDLSREPVYYNFTNPYPGGPAHLKTVTSAISLTPEVRFYLFKNQGLFYYKNQGFFLQLGLNVLQYEFYFSGSYSDHHLVSPFGGGKYYPAVPFGMGIKYPLNAKTGMELNIQTNLRSMEHWWPLQIGMKFYWLREKEERKKSPKETSIAPQTYLKAGASANMSFNIGQSKMPFGDEVHYPTYPCINLSYERTIGKRSSFVLNLESLKKSLYFENENGEPYRNCTVTQFSMVPEFRVYLQNKYLNRNLDRGFFLQAGFEVFHYMSWTKDDSKGNGFSLYPPGLNGWFERNVPLGFGIKCPLKDRQGMELNISTNLMEMIGHGNNQTFTLGMKYFWMRTKK